MKILLAYTSGQPHRDDPYITLLPTGLCYLQSTLREAGYDAQLGNFSAWSAEEVARHLAYLRPTLVGLSQWTHNRHAVLELARLVRRVLPECIVVLGGAHASFRFSQVLQQTSAVDAVVVGEGEQTLLELVECLAQRREWKGVAGLAWRGADGRVTLNPQRPLQPRLDLIPFPSLHLQHSVGLDQQLQAEFIITARGCPSACRFCSSPGFWARKVRFRSPENVVEEILYLKEQHGLIYFSLRDDTFTADRRRALAICRLLVERRAYVVWNCQSRVTTLDQELLQWMKRAGCEGIQLGVESGSPAILDRLDKSITPAQVERAARLIRQVGIHLSVYLISDVPGEQEEDIAATLRLIRRIRPDDGYVSPLAYFPGTALFDEAVAAGRVAADVFETNRSEAVYAAGRASRSSGRLLQALARAAEDRFPSGAITGEFCYVSHVVAGEGFRQQGDCANAEAEFRRITGNEPDNPWGWYLLGDLYAESGKRREAFECYRRVLALVPRHAPSLKALQDTKKRSRSGGSARS